MSKIVIKTAASVVPECNNKLINDELGVLLSDSINEYCDKNSLEFIQMHSVGGVVLIVFKEVKYNFHETLERDYIRITGEMINKQGND